ncbi:hypothetical protein BDV98DRAFT_262822 [Pterulicium gracile]|uniref:Uncharacterized protein n=1 Tax=Pterulicium gracile TaxID=1884261 RepID=A0A5C3QAM6_9AGAR|nr:hypothetical protein BDV98DRAFT_262822 [Pterula gracilis]
MFLITVAQSLCFKSQPRSRVSLLIFWLLNALCAKAKVWRRRCCFITHHRVRPAIRRNSDRPILLDSQPDPYGASIQPPGLGNLCSYRHHQHCDCHVTPSSYSHPRKPIFDGRCGKQFLRI